MRGPFRRLCLKAISASDLAFDVATTVIAPTGRLRVRMEDWHTRRPRVR
jgi:hypothetical protein